jgi:ParB-like chromosome segregation protein Spo0J
MKLNNIKSNPNNPRIIKDDKFKKLVKSLTDFPEMMEKRPIVCVTDTDGKLYPLGGNMRLKALQEIGHKEIPDNWVTLADEWTQEQRNEFVIKDNVGFGEWDWDDLANNWDVEKLEEWGLDIPDFNKLDNLEEGEEIEFEQSLQIEPPKEYILIMAEPNSVDWEDLKEVLKLKMVRRGGYKKGSSIGNEVGLERIIWWNDLKNRLYVNSSTK